VTTHTTKKINRIQQEIPEGLLVDAAWLNKHGYSTSLRSQYVSAGYLEHPAHGVYRRPRGDMTWEHAVISLQTIMHHWLVVGGRTALEMQGYEHYLSTQVREVHLYGPKRPPAWLSSLALKQRFIFHNSERLFHNNPVPRGFASMVPGNRGTMHEVDDGFHGTVKIVPWGHWDWPVIMSGPERALLEMLDELPNRESFHQVDVVFEAMTLLSPKRLQTLLIDCRSVKVKRLFFFFLDRHPHQWAKKIDRTHIDLGTGKRLLVKGGKLDKTYEITVPEDMVV
jgi:hypothetical protein